PAGMTSPGPRQRREPPLAAGLVTGADAGAEAEIWMEICAELLVATASLVDITDTVAVLLPVAFATTFRSTCLDSCGISVPSEQVTDPPSFVQVPPAAVADCNVRFEGSVASADTSLEGSSPVE